jgi:hypothetical protein
MTACYGFRLPLRSQELGDDRGRSSSTKDRPSLMPFPNLDASDACLRVGYLSQRAAGR